MDGATHPSRRYWRWAIALLVVALAAFAVFRWLGHRNDLAVRYITTEATRGDLTVTVTATGTLQPVNQVDVGSEISGTIRTVLVDFNDRVAKGQVLATLDTDQLQARVNQADAALELAKAQVMQAEATIVETTNRLKRASKLGKAGIMPEDEVDSAQAAYARAVADLARSHAQVEQAGAALEAEKTTLWKATLLSPIDGIVLNRTVEAGQTVAASFQTPVLFTLAENLTQMELHVDVDEADIGQVAQGQSAQFTVDAYADRRFPATITAVHFASQTVDGVVTYETVLTVDNSELLLRPGMTATADIIVRQIDDALLVPSAALRFKPPQLEAVEAAGGGGLVSKMLPRPPHAPKAHAPISVEEQPDQVWILRGGRPEPVIVATGASNGIVTELLSGDIEPGTPVITDAVAFGQ
ncbi:MAG: efflux RND transporter periplasmic adaptor subunit [Halieaceae bacterium]|nr:efflux RND transporter periplasmic adaptor subunit [Halieaceae bacterium]